jgi:hypothetical protein
VNCGVKNIRRRSFCENVITQLSVLPETGMYSFQFDLQSREHIRYHIPHHELIKQPGFSSLVSYSLYTV